MIRILAAHGTKDPVGRATLATIVGSVAVRTGPVRVGWLDVLEPTLAAVLADVDPRGTPVVVPLLLSEGYHILDDIPDALTEARGSAAPALGDDPRIVGALADRLREAGWAGESVVLAGTGSARDSWHAMARTVAADLGRRLGVPVDLGVLSGPGTSVADAIGRADGKVAVAAYLLAEGFFHRRLTDQVRRQAPGSVVAAPIGAHPALIDLLAERFDTFARH